MLVVLLAAALVVALVANVTLDEPAPATRPTAVPSIGRATDLPPPDAVSATWYCAAGTATGPDAQDLVVANLGGDPSAVTIDVYSGVDSRAVSREIALAPRQTVRLRVSDIADVASPGIVADAVGGRVVVEHVVRAGGDFAATPCATNTASRWYLPGGTTTKGVRDVVSLFNPTGVDAIVDVNMTTLQEGRHGAAEPQAVQALVVPRQSRVDFDLSQLVPRNDAVATTVVARSGQVVAEQQIVKDASGGKPGVGVAFGTPKLHDDWNLAFGVANGSVRRQVAVANPGTRPVELTVRALLAGDTTLEPFTVDLQEEAVSVVDLGRIPVDAQYALAFTTRGGSVALASDLGFSVANGPTGVSLEPGTAGVAPDWAFAFTRIAANARGSLAISNPGRRAARVGLQLVRNSASTPYGKIVEVAPGGNVMIDLAGAPADAALLVHASAPVVAERLTSVGASVSLTPGAGG